MEFNSARARVAPPVLEVLIARAVQLVPLQGNKACQSAYVDYMELSLQLQYTCTTFVVVTDLVDIR